MEGRICIYREKALKRKDGKRKKEEGLVSKTDQDGTKEWTEFEDDGNDELAELEMQLK